MTTDRLPTPPNDDDLERLEQEELALAQEDDLEADPSPELVSYSGTDFDVEGLVRRLGRGDIVVPNFGSRHPGVETAGFQRSFVWRRPQMDRFIESLLLGYPVPGIIFVQQADKRYLVLDGQQRLRTLAYYYDGVHDGIEFALGNVATQFKGLTYKTMPAELRRTLNNTFFQATIVKTDGTDASLEAVYQIFERLNSGGTQLTAHEIRVALYAGKFIEFLTDISNLPSWRNLYGAPSPRLRDQEVVLRFIAFYVSPGDYKRPLKKYLNDFTARHRDTRSLSLEVVKSRFDTAASLLVRAVGGRGLRTRGGAVNAALTESMLVGLARRLDLGSVPLPSDVKSAFDATLAAPGFVEAISRATADEDSVRSRLALATAEFARI